MRFANFLRAGKPLLILTLITVLAFVILQRPAKASSHTNAVFNVTFSLNGQLQNRTILPKSPLFTLTNLWTMAPSNSDGAIITPTGDNQRTIAYNPSSNHLYVVSRSSSDSSGFTIYALDAVAGTNVFTLDTSGIVGPVGEGGIGLASIAVAGDGAIYACNMSVDACGCGPNANPLASDSLFRVYRWTNGDPTNAPAQVFAGDPAGQTMPLRWGDTLSVRGSGLNTEILLDSADGAFAAILKPQDSSLNVFTNTALMGPSLGSAIGRSLQFGSTNTFWTKRHGSALRLSKYDTTNHTFSTIADYNTLPSTSGPIGLDLDRGVGALIDFTGGSSGPDGMKFYNLGNPKFPGLLDQINFPIIQQPNTNFLGQVVVSGGGLWALDANNGLMAFRVDGPHVLTFYTAIPAHIGNREILAAISSALSSNSLSSGKIIIKTAFRSTGFTSSFILRKGTNDIDISGYLPLFSQFADVTTETTDSRGTVTNAIDYTILNFNMFTPLIRFEVQGLGIWKSATLVDHGIHLTSQPFPSSITSSVDGVARVQNEDIIIHGSVAITGRKLELVPNVPPSVSLTSPSTGQTFTNAMEITLNASASDPDGNISLVEFFKDDVNLGSTTNLPYSITWTNIPEGSFTLTARATDESGDTATSTGVSVTNIVTGVSSP